MLDEGAVLTRRERLSSICLALPEVSERAEDGHVVFLVRRKTFAYFLNNHHGDGRVALVCKAQPGAQAILVDAEPARFFVPAYLGPRGWLGLGLEGDVDWGEVAGFVVEAYRMTATKRMISAMGQGVPLP
jgi:hypothetical protein